MRQWCGAYAGRKQTVGEAGFGVRCSGVGRHDLGPHTSVALFWFRS